MTARDEALARQKARWAVADEASRVVSVVLEQETTWPDAADAVVRALMDRGLLAGSPPAHYRGRVVQAPPVGAVLDTRYANPWLVWTKIGPDDA